jgi:hypothetical protein
MISLRPFLLQAGAEEFNGQILGRAAKKKGFGPGKILEIWEHLPYQSRFVANHGWIFQPCLIT